jgi:endonuclease/exonuclease/phosphatase family metal-dependent hydrolase
LNLAAQPQIADALTAWTESRTIDILLLQEVGDGSFDGAAFVSALSARLGFHSVYAAANVMGDGHTQGLAIVSRYPLDDVRVLPLTYHHLRFKSRCRIALAGTAASTSGPVHVVNVHLDTRINSKERVAQLAPVLDALDGDATPQLIGGDFNTLNIFWIRTMWPLVYLQKQTVAVAERLAVGGFHTPFKGTPATFKFLHLPLRLDWLYLKRLTPLDWSVDTIPLTDHRGVWTRVGQ